MYQNSSWSKRGTKVVALDVLNTSVDFECVEWSELYVVRFSRWISISIVKLANPCPGNYKILLLGSHPERDTEREREIHIWSFPNPFKFRTLFFSYVLWSVPSTLLPEIWQRIARNEQHLHVWHHKLAMCYSWQTSCRHQFSTMYKRSSWGWGVLRNVGFRFTDSGARKKCDREYWQSKTRTQSTRIIACVKLFELRFVSR